MKEDSSIRMALDACITDACNRYLNALDEKGLLDKKKRQCRADSVRQIRNAVLDEFMDTYVQRITDSMNIAKDGRPPRDLEKKVRHHAAANGWKK